MAEMQYVQAIDAALHDAFGDNRDGEPIHDLDYLDIDYRFRRDAYGPDGDADWSAEAGVWFETDPDTLDGEVVEFHVDHCLSFDDVVERIVGLVDAERKNRGIA